MGLEKLNSGVKERGVRECGNITKGKDTGPKKNSGSQAAAKGDSEEQNQPDNNSNMVGLCLKSGPVIRVPIRTVNLHNANDGLENDSNHVLKQQSEWAYDRCKYVCHNSPSRTFRKGGIENCALARRTRFGTLILHVRLNN
jgi:hypothetical protein